MTRGRTVQVSEIAESKITWFRRCIQARKGKFGTVSSQVKSTTYNHYRACNHNRAVMMVVDIETPLRNMLYLHFLALDGTSKPNWRSRSQVLQIEIIWLHAGSISPFCVLASVLNLIFLVWNLLFLISKQHQSHGTWLWSPAMPMEIHVSVMFVCKLFHFYRHMY